MRRVKVQLEQPYNCTDMAITRKNSLFILPDISDFHMAVVINSSCLNHLWEIPMMCWQGWSLSEDCLKLYHKSIFIRVLTFLKLSYIIASSDTLIWWTVLFYRGFPVKFWGTGCLLQELSLMKAFLLEITFTIVFLSFGHENIAIKCLLGKIEENMS